MNDQAMDETLARLRRDAGGWMVASAATVRELDEMARAWRSLRCALVAAHLYETGGLPSWALVDAPQVVTATRDVDDREVLFAVVRDITNLLADTIAHDGTEFLPTAARWQLSRLQVAILEDLNAMPSEPIEEQV